MSPLKLRKYGFLFLSISREKLFNGSCGAFVCVAMDPKHIELLEEVQQKLSDCVTDVDRVLELLVRSGSLSPAERLELEQNCSGSAEKIRLLVKMLVEKKDGDHFQEFCWALEKTQPLLLSSVLPVDERNTGKNIQNIPMNS